MERSPLFAGSINGTQITLQDLQVTNVEKKKRSKRYTNLTVTMKHLKHPITINIKYTSWSDTGVFGYDVSLENTGSENVSLDSASSINLQLKGLNQQLKYLAVKSVIERQMQTTTIKKDRFQLENQSGRSNSGPFILVVALSTDYKAFLHSPVGLLRELGCLIFA